MLFPVSNINFVSEQLNSALTNIDENAFVNNLYSGPKNIIVNNTNDHIKNNLHKNKTDHAAYYPNTSRKVLSKMRKKLMQNHTDKDLKLLLDRTDKLNADNWQQASFSEKVVHFSLKKIASYFVIENEYQNNYEHFLSIIEKLLDINKQFHYEVLFKNFVDDLDSEELLVLDIICATINELEKSGNNTYTYYLYYLPDRHELTRNNLSNHIKLFLCYLHIDLHFNNLYLSKFNTIQIKHLAKEIIEKKDWPNSHPHGIFFDMVVDDLALIIFNAIRHKEAKTNLHRENYQLAEHFKDANAIDNQMKNLISNIFAIEDNAKFLKPVAYSNFMILNQTGKTFYEVCENLYNSYKADFLSLINLQNNYIKKYGLENWLLPLTGAVNERNADDLEKKEIVFEQIANMLNQNPFYKIGSIEYAQACTLNVINKWQGHLINITDDVILTKKQFKHVIYDYAKNATTYPINPLYFFSLAMASSNNIYFQMNHDLNTFDNQIRVEIVRKICQLDFTSRKTFLEYIRNTNKSFNSLINFNNISDKVSIPNEIQDLLEQYQVFRKKSLLLTSNNAEDQFKLIMNYGKAIYLSNEQLPKVSFTSLFFPILKKYGLSDQEILEKKEVSIVKNLIRTYRENTQLLSPIQEIYIKLKSFYGKNKLITIKDKIYQIDDLAKSAATEFIQNLYTNEIVIAHARQKIFSEKLIEEPVLLAKYVNEIILSLLENDIEQIKQDKLINDEDSNKDSYFIESLKKNHSVKSSLIMHVMKSVSSLIQKGLSQLISQERSQILMEDLETELLEIVKMTPIIGSTYTVIDGMIHEDALEIMAGSIALSKDILSRSLNAEMLSVNIFRFDFEKATTLGKKVKKTGEKEIEKIGLASNSKTNNNPNELIDQVLSGNKDVKWQAPNGENAELKYIEDLNEVVPLRLHSEVDQRYIVLDWETGDQNFNYHYVDSIKIPDTGQHQFFSRKFTGLNGGGKISDFLNYDVRGTPLKNRSTMLQLNYSLSEMTEYSMAKNKNIENSFKKFFKKKFTNNDEQVLFNELDEHLMRIYDNSPTFRHYLNNFIDNAKKNDGYHVMFKNVHPATDYVNNLIGLPYPEKLENFKYVTSIDGTGTVLTKPTLQQIYLHEILHAITYFDDLVDVNALVDRGPVITLESRIYYEAGADVPERIVYRADKNLASNKINVQDESIIAAWYENNIIDDYIDAKIKHSLHKRTLYKIYGNNIHDEPSITNYEKFSQKIIANSNIVINKFNFNIKDLPNLFEFTTDASNDSFFFSSSKSVYSQLVNAYTKSKSFRKSYKAWLKIKNQSPSIHNNEQWELNVNNEIKHPDINNVYGIDEAKSTVNFYAGQSFYLSEKGMMETPLLRQIIEIYAEIIFHDLKITDLTKEANGRKAHQIFAEKILKELGALKSARITGENYVDDLSTRWIYKPLSKLTRKMQTENEYLEIRDEALNSITKAKPLKKLMRRNDIKSGGFFRFLNLDQHLLRLKNINASNFDEFYQSNH